MSCGSFVPDREHSVTHEAICRFNPMKIGTLLTKEIRMIATHEIKETVEKHDRVWSRIYAPLRRTLAGTWVKGAGGNRFQLTLDAYGSYHLRCFDTNTDGRGRYTIVGERGSHFIALHSSDSTIQLLRIEDVDALRLRLADDQNNKIIDLARRPLPA